MTTAAPTLLATLRVFRDADGEVFAAVVHGESAFFTEPGSTIDGCLHRAARRLCDFDPPSLAHAVPGEPSPHAPASPAAATEHGDA